MNTPPIHYMNTLLILFANIKDKQMKKIILIITILFTNINVNSQITKGYWMYGGSGKYFHRTNIFNNKKTSKYSFISIKANAGYFIKDKWAIGGIIRYDDNLTPLPNQRNVVGGIGVFTRYYFLEPDKITNIYSQVYYTYTVNFTQLDTKGNILDLHYYGTKIGYVIFLTNSVGLETFFEYEMTSPDSFSNTSINITIGMGFNIHLTK